LDMKILDSPASTILVTNSDGSKYDILTPRFVYMIQFLMNYVNSAQS